MKSLGWHELVLVRYFADACWCFALKHLAEFIANIIDVIQDLLPEVWSLEG